MANENENLEIKKAPQEISKEDLKKVNGSMSIPDDKDLIEGWKDTFCGKCK